MVVCSSVNVGDTSFNIIRKLQHTDHKNVTIFTKQTDDTKQTHYSGKLSDDVLMNISLPLCATAYLTQF